MRAAFFAMEWIIQIPVLFFSVIFHEFAHGWMAKRRGDDTAYLSGRLTFNPVPHIDPFGTILLPALCALTHMPMFGWAKPVPINPYRMYEPRRDVVKVALAGPLSNLVLVGASLLLANILVFIPLGGLKPLLLHALFFAVIINLCLAIFNLIPIAPLDGSQVLAGILPHELAMKYERHAPYGMWIMLALIISGLLKYVLTVPLNIALAFLLNAKLMPVIMLYM